MEDHEVLAAIGRANRCGRRGGAAVFVVVEVAVIESQGEEHARNLVSQPGAALREPEPPVRERPDRRDLKLACHDAQAVLADRHVLAHSIALEQVEFRGQSARVIWHPRSGRETQITAAQILGHTQDIRIAARRCTSADCRRSG